MTTFTAPKTWSTNEILTSPDMNTYVRDNMKAIREHIIAGTTGGTGTGGSTHSGTITFGVTFTAAPVVVATVRASTGAPVFIGWTATPTTTTVAYMVGLRDTTDALSSAYTINWIAIGDQ